MPWWGWLILAIVIGPTVVGLLGGIILAPFAAFMAWLETKQRQRP